MKTEKLSEVHDYLCKILKVYIETILNEYEHLINASKLNKLKNITDYRCILKLSTQDNVNSSTNDLTIDMPLCMYRILEKMKKLPGFGYNRDNCTYEDEAIIENNNTLITYIVNAYKSGLNTKRYYEDLLLHDTLHFCGCGGQTALKEGISELLTRKIAKKHGFKTNTSRYSKELNIALELQNILGEDVIDQIAFIDGSIEIYSYLAKTVGIEVANLYLNVERNMEQEFQEKYYKHMDSYNGIRGLLDKIINYSKIDYSDAYAILEMYKIEHQNEKKK